MIRRVRCFVAECDDCHVAAGDDEQGYTIHFDTDGDVLDHLTTGSWTVTPDGHLRCPVCTARHLCGRLDHLWDVWHVCCCHGAIPRHHTNGCPLVRSCAQCGAFDEATLAHLPTTDEPTRGC